MSNELPSELQELIRLARGVGADPDWVQGGGGNVSVKSADGRAMWVKASGVALGEMEAERGWARLDLKAALRVLDESGLSKLPEQEREERVLALLRAAVLEPKGARPSVESSLHAQLSRVVAHSHPIHLIAFLCSCDSRELWQELLGELAADALYVPYVDPGFTLAARLRTGLRARAAARRAPRSDARQRAESEAGGSAPRIVLLENHGLFVSAGTVDECLALHERVNAIAKRWAGGRRVNPVRFDLLRIAAASGDAQHPICANDVAAFASATLSGMPRHGEERALEEVPPAARVRAALLAGGAQPVLVRQDDSPVALELLREEALLRRLASEGAFTPDQIAYCRTLPVLFEEDLEPASVGRLGDARAGALESWSGAVREYRERHGLDPKVALAPGLGVFHAAADLAELRVVAETHRLVMTALLRSVRGGGPRFLDRRETAFVEQWEVERYRAALLSGRTAPLSGRVALLVADDDEDLGRVPAAAAPLLDQGATVVALCPPASAPPSAPRGTPAHRFLVLRAGAHDAAGAWRAARVVADSLGGIDLLLSPGAPAGELAPPWREIADRIVARSGAASGARQ